MWLGSFAQKAVFKSILPAIYPQEFLTKYYSSSHPVYTPQSSLEILPFQF